MYSSTHAKPLDPDNTENWAYSELVEEVIRLRAISEKQSKNLAQALLEKNSASNPATSAAYLKLRNDYINLRETFDNVQECHRYDYELLNRVKSVLRDLVNR